MGPPLAPFRPSLPSAPGSTPAGPTAGKSPLFACTARRYRAAARAMALAWQAEVEVQGLRPQGIGLVPVRQVSHHCSPAPLDDTEWRHVPWRSRGREKSRCRECDPKASAFCECNGGKTRKANCELCDGSNICPHGRQKQKNGCGACDFEAAEGL